MLKKSIIQSYIINKHGYNYLNVGGEATKCIEAQIYIDASHRCCEVRRQVVEFGR
jgi:hypothetical protein